MPQKYADFLLVMFCMCLRLFVCDCAREMQRLGGCVFIPVWKVNIAAPQLHLFLCLYTVGPISCIFNMSCRFACVLTCLLFLQASGAVRFLDMPRELVMDVNKG